METTTTCANCGGGEESSNKLKKCGACLSAKYCSAVCQAAHRPLHKKACKKRAAEIFDEKLFADPPPPEDCPICFIVLPILEEIQFKSCCGKVLCGGCIHAMNESREGKDLCAFCRTALPRSCEEEVKRVKKLMESNNACAFLRLASYYAQGVCGLTQNYQKANELYLKGGELGCADAYYNLGQSFSNGTGMVVDLKKAQQYWELAAMGGHVEARHNLGVWEQRAGNISRAFKHYIMAAKLGDKDSLGAVKDGYKNEIVTKDEYASILRAHQQRLDGVKSVARDRAEASGLFNRHDGRYHIVP